MSVFGLRSPSRTITARWSRAASRPAMRTRPNVGSFMRLVALDDAVIGVGLLVLFAAGPRRWWAWAAVAATLVILQAADRYRPRITLSVAHEVWIVLAAVAFPLLVVAALRPDGAKAAELAVAGAAAVVLMLVQRIVLYARIRSLRARGILCDRTLVIGAGSVGVAFTQVLEEHPEYGLKPIGFLDHVDGEGLPLPVLGDLDLLRMVLSEERVDRVVVAYGVTRGSAMIDMLRACDDSPVEIHILPRFFELGLAANRRMVDDVWGYPLVRLRRPRVSGARWRAKRLFDVVVAGGALLLLAPLYTVLAVAVKLSSPGPVHFRQQRIGQRGTTVEILKFRSMRVHAESDTEWSARRDVVTGVGRIMRNTGLDEIPQLWNIVRGDMSLVGPRPERPYFVEQFKSEIPRYDHRHRVPVGLTGEAQIHGLRGDTSIDERARFDNHYIENWSLWRDVVILVRTAAAVVRHARSNRRAGPAAAGIAAATNAEVGSTVTGDGEATPAPAAVDGVLDAVAPATGTAASGRLAAADAGSAAPGEGAGHRHHVGVAAPGEAAADGAAPVV